MHMQVKGAAAKKAAAAEGTHKIGQLLAKATSKPKKKPLSDSTSEDEDMDLGAPSGSGGSDDGGLPGPSIAPEKPAASSKKAAASKATASAAKDALGVIAKPKKAAAPAKPKAKALPVDLDSDDAGPSTKAVPKRQAKPAPKAAKPTKAPAPKAQCLDDSDDDMVRTNS